MVRTICLLLVAAFAGVAVSADKLSADPAGSCTNPIHLDPESTALKMAFNDARGKARLLFVIDPVCPACLRGLHNVVLESWAPHADRPELAAFIVHVPAIGGKERDVRRTCKALEGRHVVHYWDPKGHFGGALSRGLDLKTVKGEWVYAWDVWLVYEAGASWSGKDPPRPKMMMHQLMALSDGSAYDFFDTAKFGNAIGQALDTAK